MELAEKSRADEDYIRFQLEQLEEAHLAEGEQDALLIIFQLVLLKERAHTIR